jgi:hypothetical protein
MQALMRDETQHPIGFKPGQHGGRGQGWQGHAHVAATIHMHAGRNTTACVNRDVERFVATLAAPLRQDLPGGLSGGTGYLKVKC